MSLLTTWTVRSLPAAAPLAAPDPASPDARAGHYGPHTPWDCVNCDLLNAGTRRRCADCGTRRD